jgi:hypothetical protein
MSKCAIFVLMSVKCFFKFMYKPVVYERKIFSLSRRIALQTRCKGALHCVFGHVDRHSMPADTPALRPHNTLPVV